MLTRSEALPLAKSLYADYQKADTDHMFGRSADAPNPADYCYRHGWVIVCGHSFNNEDLTGRAYDITQGGWAFI